jgi:DNA ligase-1
MAESADVSTEKEVQIAFRRSRTLGYEGLVVKDPDSPYAMGKRGSGWVKLKEELDTLDVVIVAAEYGHGKRAGVISDYTFAVRDGDQLKTLGKAYSGLTDKEIDEMTRRLKEITIKDFGYRRQVRPEIVIEVAFDSIQRSDRHDGGFALRFPRIKRIRTDKSPEDIDSMEKVEKIFSGQKLKVDEK